MAFGPFLLDLTATPQRRNIMRKHKISAKHAGKAHVKKAKGRKRHSKKSVVKA